MENANSYMEALQPALINLALIVITAVGAIIAAYARSASNKFAESKDRQALHSAMETGATLAVAKYPTDARMAAEYTVDYARKSTPDALDNLAPSMKDEKDAASPLESEVVG